MLRFRQNILHGPREGWYYVEGKQAIRGESPSDVADKLAAYRIRNGRNPGNPNKDVLNFWFDLRPELIEVAPDGTPDVAESHSAQAGGVLAWLQSIMQHGSDTETGNAAIEERTNICLACPCNLPIPCKSDIKAEIDRRSFMLGKGKVIPGLNSCLFHMIDLRVAIRMRTEFLNPNFGNKHKCWL